jgi:acetamidase/formamidase
MGPDAHPRHRPRIVLIPTFNGTPAARIGDDGGVMHPRHLALTLATTMLAASAAFSLLPATTVRAQAPAAAHHLPSRPETLVWGEIPINRPAALTVASGDTVTIDTLSHSGATQAEEPRAFLARHGVAAADVLPDVVAFWASREGRPREGRSGHVLTGPVYVQGAEPGDMLEIQILDLSLRVPYGMNNGGPTSGVLGAGYPGTRPDDPPPSGATRLIRTGEDQGRPVAILNDRVHVPLQPFMGIMAVAPPVPKIGQPAITVDGVQSTRPPGVFGGNLDIKDLTAGTKLFLPVFHPGAQVYVGDPHSVQGDGEVNGTAVEHSLTGRFRLVVHKRRALKWPRGETPTHYMVMGIDIDLDRAMRIATQEAVDFLVAEKQLSPADAYTLASIGCDFRVAEAVDLTQVVIGMIPKHVFR